MRQITGKHVVELSDENFQQLVASYRGVLLDVGTGDGKHVLQLAKERPDWLIVGLDAAKDNLRKAAAKASAKPAKGGLPNAMYVWSAAESPPAVLRNISELHILMPWGSLLRGLLDDELTVLRALGICCRPGAEFLITLNLHAWRPAVPEVGKTLEPTPESVLGELAKRYARVGWQVSTAAYLTAEEISALATSWTRRLNSSREQLDVLAIQGTVNPES